MPSKRPTIGDVIEIRTPGGLGYAQYIHEHRDPPVYGSLLRALPGCYPQRPADLERLVAEPEAFMCFLPLGAACKRGLVAIVSSFAVPSWAQAFPTFRRGLAGPGGHVRRWFVWDGRRETPVEQLTPELAALPVLTGVWNDTLLAERIAAGWRPPD